MKLHLFFDHSVLDLFINDRWATSVRIFPTSQASTGVSLFAAGDTPLLHAEAWKMIPVDEEDPTEDLVSTTAPPHASTRKILRDGHVCILQGDNSYAITGKKLR